MGAKWQLGVKVPLSYPEAFPGSESLGEKVPELVRDNPLIDTTQVEEAHNGGFRPVEGHHILKQYPED